MCQHHQMLRRVGCSTASNMNSSSAPGSTGRSRACKPNCWNFAEICGNFGARIVAVQSLLRYRSCRQKQLDASKPAVDSERLKMGDAAIKERAVLQAELEQMKREQQALATRMQDAQAGASVAQQRAITVEADAKEASRRLIETAHSHTMLQKQLQASQSTVVEIETVLRSQQVLCQSVFFCVADACYSFLSATVAEKGRAVRRGEQTSSKRKSKVAFCRPGGLLLLKLQQWRGYVSNSDKSSSRLKNCSRNSNVSLWSYASRIHCCKKNQTDWQWRASSISSCNKPFNLIWRRRHYLSNRHSRQSYNKRGKTRQNLQQTSCTRVPRKSRSSAKIAV